MEDKIRELLPAGTIVTVELLHKVMAAVADWGSDEYWRGYNDGLFDESIANRFP